MLKLKIILASTRPERKGEPIAKWTTEIAKTHPEFEVELLDLLAINLPFLDETAHPRFKKYEHQHTFDWSTKIDDGDAYIFVTSEYNYGYPASLKNAIDYLFQEWIYKPVGFVSYGGLAGGTRAVQQLKEVVTSMKMMPMMESVNIPFFMKQFNPEGTFTPDEIILKSLNTMLNELSKWAEAMKPMRSKV